MVTIDLLETSSSQQQWGRLCMSGSVQVLQVPESGEVISRFHWLTATPFMWQTLDGEAMEIFFTAHSGQIDGLCCGCGLLSVYNVAFALHCPNPVTPRGKRLLLLHCPFTSLSSLIIVPSHVWFPFWLLSFAFLFYFCFVLKVFQRHVYFSFFFICCLALLAPDASFVIASCFNAFRDIWKPPARLCLLSLPQATFQSFFATVTQ